MYLYIHTYRCVYVYICLTIYIYTHTYIWEWFMHTFSAFWYLCIMNKRLFFGYKRTVPTWIGPENHVKNHHKDYQQSMTILTLLHVSSHDKYVKNPVKKPQKTFFMRESKKQADLSALVVLLHELKFSTKTIPQRIVVILHELVFCSLCNIKWVTKIHIWAINLHRSQHYINRINSIFIMFYIIKYASWMLSRFPRPCITALLHANDFSFYPIFLESENACVELLHELVLSCVAWNVSCLYIIYINW